jgi:hypothetical protein
MTERLEKWHVETDESTTKEEIRVAVAMLNLEMKDPDISPRRREELNRRIGHLVYEYHARENFDGKA